MIFNAENKVERYIFVMAVSLSAGIYSTCFSMLWIYLFLILLLFIFRNKKIYLFIIIFFYIAGIFYAGSILKSVEEPLDGELKNIYVLIEENKGKSFRGKVVGGEDEVLKNQRILFYHQELLLVGEVYRGNCLLERFSEQRIPNGFNEKHFYFSSNVYYKGSVKELVIQKDYVSLYGELLKIRKKIMDDYSEKYSGKSKGLVRAVVFGDKSLFPQDTRDTFQLLGLSHLLAVSGLHGGIIGGAAYRLFSPAGFHAKNIAAWVILSVYAFLAGFTPSINRAVLMFFFFSFGKLFQRHRDPWTILALSGIPQILFNPFVVLSPGFILSYSTVAGIILFHKNKKSSLSLSCAAVLGTIPVLVYYFNTISLAGIFANLFYVPLFALITFLAMSGVLIPFIPMNLFLDPFLNFVIEGTERIGEYFAFLDISVSTPKIWEAVLYYLLIYIIYNKVKLSLSVKTALLVILLFFNLYPGKWEAVFIDVGQGDSALISTPGGKVVLIDGGPWGREVEGFLSSRGINKPDLYIVSHGDSDHINGLIWLMKRKAPKNILLPANSRSNELLEELLLLGEEKNSNIIFGYTGQKFQIDNTEFEILSPGKDQEYTTSNNHSLVIMVRYENKSLLFTGDAEKDVLENISGGYNIDVIKAPHHGSNTGNSQLFFNRNIIKNGIISCGINNRYGHPGTEFLKIMEKERINLYRTDLQGTITVEYNGEEDFKIIPFLD